MIKVEVVYVTQIELRILELEKELEKFRGDLLEIESIGAAIEELKRLKKEYAIEINPEAFE